MRRDPLTAGRGRALTGKGGCAASTANDGPGASGRALRARRRTGRSAPRPRRYETGAYRAWALHVAGLLEEAGLGERPGLAHALLAPLAPDVYAHQRASGITARQVADGLALIARRAMTSVDGSVER